MNFTPDHLIPALMLLFVLVIIVMCFMAFRLLFKHYKDNPTESAPTLFPTKSGYDKEGHLFPLKLQAYERIVLFLERIEPSSLLMRSKSSEMNATSLHASILDNIRDEYEHNVAQQIYVSDNAWNLVKQAKEETIRIVNMAAQSMEKDSTANDLTRNVFEKMMVLPKSPSQIALDYVKQEIKELI